MGLGRSWVGVGVGVCFFGKFFSALEGRLEFGASGRKGGGFRERESERERKREPWELRTGLDRRRLSTALFGLLFPLIPASCIICGGRSGSVFCESSVYVQAQLGGESGRSSSFSITHQAYLRWGQEDAQELHRIVYLGVFCAHLHPLSLISVTVISEQISILVTPSNSGTNKASTNSCFDSNFDFDSHPPTRPSYWRFWSQTPTFLASYSSSSLASCGLSSWDMEVWVTWLTWSASCRHEWCMLVATLIRRREVSMASLYLYMSDLSPQADYCTWDGKWKIPLCVLRVSSWGWNWLWSAPRKT